MIEKKIKESEQQILATSFARSFTLKTCKNLKIEVKDVKDRHNEDVWQMEVENQEAKVFRTKVI